MNPEHVEIVKQGKEAIEDWRLAHSEEQLDLSQADLSFADLSEADLPGVDLSNANLVRANMSAARLSNADLSGANLSAARLSEANLSNAVLSGADLSYTNLLGANLFGADLLRANLVRANLYEAILIGAKLYGTARDDWDIEGIKCRYMFLDWEGKERSPRDRDLEPGEFERIYAQLPTIEYVFEQGMTPLDPLVMDRVVQAINERTPEFDLQIDSINARGLQPTIKFTVQHEEHKAAALEAVVAGYQFALSALQCTNETLLQMIDQLMKGQNEAFVRVAEQLINRVNDPSFKIGNIGPNSMWALGGSSFTINREEYNGHLEEIERAIQEAPPGTLTETAKREALDIVSGTFKDVAKGKAKEVAEAILQLGMKAGPSIVNTQAYQFLTNPPL